ncbi:hypothetical protein HYDPIDRAFT_51605, partial [Hydnomerulius pinastri MD-312]
LIDCGAGGEFLDQKFIQKIGILQHSLCSSITVKNVDGSPNKAGLITHYSTLFICFLITDLGKEDIILGLPWLTSENPIINWK